MPDENKKKNGQWYTNQEIYEMIFAEGGLRDQLKDLAKILCKTREELEKYSQDIHGENGLRETIEECKAKIEAQESEKETAEVIAARLDEAEEERRKKEEARFKRVIKLMAAGGAAVAGAVALATFIVVHILGG